jgi:cellulose synthase/poly-beta-1,6-N-acetylglucosamine synthase-like glycosyltransferase
MIVYTYLGYPLLLALLAPLGNGTSYPKTESPAVTLLIAAYNEQAVIQKKLENSLALDYPPDRLQIIVAADGSDDKTVEIVKRYAHRGVQLSYDPRRRGKMAAINRAMKYARSEIVVFTDANNLYAKDTIAELVAPFSNPKVGAVAGAKMITESGDVLGKSEGLYWKYESFIKEKETKLGTCTGISGEVFALRRALFEPPPEKIINDDFYLAMSVISKGFQVHYAPEARSYEPVSLSAQDEVERRSRIIAGRYQFLALASDLLPWRRPAVLWRVISHKICRLLVPWAMIAVFLTNLATVIWPLEAGGLLSLSFPYNWALLGAQIVFYLAAWLGSRPELKPSTARWLYLPTFLVNSNLATIRGFYQFLRGEQTALWKRVPRRSDQIFDL